MSFVVRCVALGCATVAVSLGGGVATAAPAWPIGARLEAARADRPLLAVSCSSPRACTAVGGLVAERWNGRRWSGRRVAVPAFSTAALDFLTGVSCAGGRACMAVGTERPAASASVTYDYTPLAEAWSNGTWFDESPPATQTPNDYLQAVSCPSPSDCVAVGQGIASSLAMGWDGGIWTVQLAPVPSTAMSILNGVSCTSATSCVAVGYVQPDPLSPSSAVIEDWNGISWSVVPTPATSPLESAALNAVSCTSRSCIAVGSLGFQQLVERWNGDRWSIPRSAKDAPGAALNGVSCVSSRECVAVGGLTDSSHQAFAERWSGSHWAIEPTPAPPGGSLLWSVSCPAARACFAVGGRGDGPLLEHWNGRSWSIQRAS